MIRPIYTPETCKAAYQLRWSLALLFATEEIPSELNWIEPLREQVQRDGVRLLEHRLHPPNIWFFLLSTKPTVAPPQIVKSVKARLQHLVRASAPKAFRRNFSLASVGDARRHVVESYVASQISHHRMADTRVQSRLKEFQLVFPDVDLSAAEFSSHGRYVYSLHLVLVHQGRWREIREDRLAITRDTFLRAARKKRHRVSRLALLPDHVHATIGCNFGETPEEVALGYLNNLAYGRGMKPLFCSGYYVGTFGDYDIGAIRRA
ncbi:MAG TPA: hypothetical protein VNS63_27330 [Blastocatellia bacterium]|nr:hypothetical protein [Blastocatellia bacterium]